jgi:glycosyltransferase involved in cell wall biosynthesis
MKILIIVGSAERGGTENQILGLTKQLNSYCDIYVAFLKAKGPLLQQFSQAQIRWIDLGINLKENPFQFIYRIWKFLIFLQKSKFNIVHAYLAESILLTWPLLLLIRSNSVKIAGVRGTVIRRGDIQKFLYRYFLRKSDAVVCNSEDLVGVVRGGYKFKKSIQCVPNGVNEAGAIPNYSIQYPIGIVVANFHPYKGHKLLLDAVSKCPSHIKFIFVGNGKLLQATINQANLLNISDRIAFMGEQNSAEYFHLANFAIHPSETEGLSNAIMEAQSFALPVIAFDVGGNRELVKDMQNGILLKQQDSQILANAIIKIATNLQMQQYLGSRAAIDSTKYSWENVASQLLNFYQKNLK